MTSERSSRIEEIFLSATELPLEERDAYLDAQCGTDESLRAAVDELIGHFEAADGKLLARPAVVFTNGLEMTDAAPTQVGSYKVIRTLGVGGMGIVYEAEQDTPCRTVAVKVIRPGLATKQMLTRFRHEVQVLARLQHPGIAHIYEAGVAPVSFEDGSTSRRPFFAMELIRGRALGDFAAHRKMGTRDRLKLMTRICSAVHHAHQKGVIHRDLKPQNILVDREGQPKVLDFGVARAVDADVQTVTLRTDIGQLLGTVSYMSPEQVQGDSSNLDTRSDVYTLGVILYELLAGDLPYAVGACTIPEAVRIIQEENPTLLSSVNPSFRGDLETIAQKALEKEKDRRYQSAAEMALDIERYLNDEPIIARPPSRIYQIRKFAKRNRGLVGGLAAAFVALVAGVAVATVLAIQAKDQARLASSQATRALDALDEAEAVTTFLTDMLASANPTKQNRDLLVLDVLEGASAVIGEQWTERPLIEARLRQTIGRTYRSLGELAQAEEHLRQSLDIQIAMLGMDDPATQVTALALSTVYGDLGRYAESAPLKLKVLDTRRRLLGNDDPLTLNAVGSYATLLWKQGKYAEANTYQREALEGTERVLGPDHLNTLNEMEKMGGLLRDLGRYEEAEEYLRRALSGKERVLGKDDLATIDTGSFLGALLKDLGRVDEAEPYYRRTLDVRRSRLGNGHWQTQLSLNNLGSLLKSRGKYEEAESLFRAAAEGCRRDLGPSNPFTLDILNNLGSVLLRQGKLDEAEEYIRQALDGRLETLGEDHPSLLTSYNNMGILKLHQGRLEDSERFFLELLEKCRQQLGENHLKTLITLHNLGKMLQKQDRLEEAAEYYREAFEGYARTLGGDHGETREALTELCDVLNLLGRTEEASSYEKRLEHDTSKDRME